MISSKGIFVIVRSLVSLIDKLIFSSRQSTRGRFRFARHHKLPSRDKITCVRAARNKDWFWMYPIKRINWWQLGQSSSLCWPLFLLQFEDNQSYSFALFASNRIKVLTTFAVDLRMMSLLKHSANRKIQLAQTEVSLRMQENNSTNNRRLSRTGFQLSPLIIAHSNGLASDFYHSPRTKICLPAPERAWRGERVNLVNCEVWTSIKAPSTLCL